MKPIITINKTTGETKLLIECVGCGKQIDKLHAHNGYPLYDGRVCCCCNCKVIDDRIRRIQNET